MKVSRPFITLQHVRVQLEEALLLRDLCWTIGEGEHWAVIGPNGSGKSVLAAAIAGILPVRGGEIDYPFVDRLPPDGSRFGRSPENEIALVSFENQQAMVRRAGADCFARWQSMEEEQSPLLEDLFREVAYRRHGADSTAPCAEFIRLFQLSSLLQRRFIHLSNGETRRAAIALALAESPQLLILDDPFCGLDEANRTKFQHFLHRLVRRKKGPQLILITPRREEIPAEISYLLYLHEGSAVYSGRREGAPVRYLNSSEKEERGKGTKRALPAPPPHRKIPVPGAELIHLEAATVRYGEMTALDRVSWTVCKGEHWALLGPNGSGKTTLLSLVTGDHPQVYANPVRLLGKARGAGEGLWDIRRYFGWLSPDLHMHYPAGYSCLAVVCSGFFDSLGLYKTPSPPQRRSAMDWLDWLGLADEAKTDFRRLSAGAQRRILLARAVVKYPPLLVLDEPCQGLDRRHRMEMVSLVDRFIRESGSTLIYVTHHREEIPACITHELHLHRGKILFSGIR